jgi:hypothetical protein
VKITAADLRAAGRNCPQVDAFEALFPDGVEITRRNIAAAAERGWDFDVFAEIAYAGDAEALADYRARRDALLGAANDARARAHERLVARRAELKRLEEEALAEFEAAVEGGARERHARPNALLFAENRRQARAAGRP